MAGAQLSDDTWAQAQADYQSGQTGEQVCRRYGMGLRTLREHAANNGWRRQDTDAPPHHDDDLTPFDDLEPADIEREALRRATAAVMRGQSHEARRWQAVYAFWRDARLVQQKAVARDVERRAREEDIAFNRAIREGIEEMRATDRGPVPYPIPKPAFARPAPAPSRPPHSPHPVFNSAVTPNRSERRRLAKLGIPFDFDQEDDEL